MNEDMEKMLQEAPAPTLTLEPFAEEKEEPAVVEKEEAVQPVDAPRRRSQIFQNQLWATSGQRILARSATS